MYELVIIGGGPAGSAAAVYAGRKKIKTLVITSDFGGQSVVSPDIHNWIGEKSISGQLLASKLEEHTKEYSGDTLQILSSTKVENITKIDDNLFEIFTNNKDKSHIKTKTILVASGSVRKKLPAKNADNLEHKGLTYCASCDGLFFAEQDVVVVGSGNSAFESALQLSAYCKSVTLLTRSASFKADQITIESVKADQKIKIITDVVVEEILGSLKVEGVIVQNQKTFEKSKLDVTGVFVEIGQIPSTQFAENILEIDDFGRIKIDFYDQKTSQVGIWAAGDCTNVKYHQNNIAAGDGVRALEDIYQYLKSI